MDMAKCLILGMTMLAGSREHGEAMTHERRSRREREEQLAIGGWHMA